MAHVEIYTRPLCPFCVRAKRLLDSKRVPYTEIDITLDARQRGVMMERAQRHTVPQIFIDDRHVGGSDDLIAAEQSGQLDRWLSDPQHHNTPVDSRANL